MKAEASPAPQPREICERCESNDRRIHNSTLTSGKLRVPCSHDWHNEQPAPQPEGTPTLQQMKARLKQMEDEDAAEPPVPPAGARDVKDFIDNWIKEHNYHEWMCGNTNLSNRDIAKVCLAWAAHERERADRAERQAAHMKEIAEQLTGKLESREAEVESLRKERDQFGHTIITLDRANEWHQAEEKRLKGELGEMRDALTAWKARTDGHINQLQQMDATQFTHARAGELAIERLVSDKLAALLSRKEKP